MGAGLHLEICDHCFTLCCDSSIRFLQHSL